MMTGTPKFNSIAVGELRATFIERVHELSAKAAFVNTTTGTTHGWTTNTQWSTATLQKLEELRAAMEEDLGRLHFDDAHPETPRHAQDVGGLGEFLSSPEGPSI